MKLLRRLICGEQAEAEKPVPDSSPARLLADSLTSPETRDEWTKESISAVTAIRTTYTNKSREIKLNRYIGAYVGVVVSTPFRLSEAEEKLVRSALEAFDKRLRLEDEKAALSRLIAPEGK